MSRKWAGLTKQQAGYITLVGFVFLAIGVFALDGATKVSLWGLAVSLVGMLLFAAGVLRLFQ